MLFLQGEFGKDEQETHVKVTDGFENYCLKNFYLKLLSPICGLKNSARAFRRKLLKSMNKLRMKRTTADPCLHDVWIAASVVTQSVCIDDCLHCGKRKELESCKEILMQGLDCEDSGKLQEHVG